MAFTQKYGDYVSNFESDIEVNLKLLKLAKRSGVNEAMAYFEKVRPELVCTEYKKIESNLKAFLKNIKEKN